MGGRGRGRAALSFNVEALGFGAGEALPGPQLQPPPAYPLLEHPAAPLYASPRGFECLKYKVDYLNEWSRLKLDLNEASSSPSGASAPKRKPGLSEPSSSRTALPQLDYYWGVFPPELRPMKPAKKAKQGSRTAVSRVPNIDDLFSELEKAENSSAQVKTEVEESEEQQGSDAEQEREGQADEVYEDSDQEMDDGTDYNQNYFDNGDNYLDEDDDDDGPIY